MHQKNAAVVRTIAEVCSASPLRSWSMIAIDHESVVMVGSKIAGCPKATLRAWGGGRGGAPSWISPARCHRAKPSS